MKNEKWRKWGLSLLILTVVVLLPTMAAAENGEDVNQLKAELEAQRQRQAEMENRINQLETRQKLKERALTEKIEQATATPASEQKEAEIPEALKWASKLHWFGDFRYRYEYIDQREDEVRHRNRIRARLGLGVTVNDEWDLGFRLATGQGEVSGDPVSTNQTLDEAFSRKPFWLDQAFLAYHPQWLERLNLYAGKTENPFYRVGKNQMIWDSDLTPEGVGLLYGMPLGEQTSLNWVAGGFWVNEESSGGDTNVGGVYAGDYDVFELFIEFGTQFEGLPVAVFGDWVRNSVAAASGADTGWSSSNCGHKVPLAMTVMVVLAAVESVIISTPVWAQLTK